MKINKLLISTAITAILPTFAAADEPSYSYVEGGYYRVDSDGLEPDGYYLDGAADLGNNLYLRGRYSSIEDTIDFGLFSFDLELDQFEFGLGYHAPIGANSSFNVHADWIRYDADVISDNGYQVGVGLRGFITDNLELTGDLSYYDVDIADAAKVEAGILYHATENMGLSFLLGSDDGDTTIKAGLRFKF